MNERQKIIIMEQALNTLYDMKNILCLNYDEPNKYALDLAVSIHELGIEKMYSNDIWLNLREAIKR